MTRQRIGRHELRPAPLGATTDRDRIRRTVAARVAAPAYTGRHRSAAS